MSDTVFPTLRKIQKTPLRDLVRGRISQRLDWAARVAAAGLPPSAAQLISRVIKRTRLFRLEKADVANELTAHFLDGLARENSVEQLISKFGDERLAARLIRITKRRGRPWPWRLLSLFLRGIALVVGIYAILLIRFCVGHPTCSVDYLALVNGPIAQTASSERAWPLWRQAILQCTSSSQRESRELVFAETIFPADDEKPDWGEAVKWLDAHAGAIKIARDAAQKPALGFILGPNGSANDPEMHFPRASEVAGEPLISVLLPQLTYLRSMAKVLSLDSKLAAERGEDARVENDLLAMLSLGRQLRGADGFLITQFVALAVDRIALDRLQWVLFNKPNLLKDEALLAWRMDSPLRASPRTWLH